jgi:hypothetical protein
MVLLRLLTFVGPLGVAYTLMWAGTRVVLNRQRTKAGGLRSEIAARMRFTTTVDHACLYRISAFGRSWVSLRGPRRLIVGSDAFIFEAHNALKEFAFRGGESSIAFSQAPSVTFVTRDWIVFTGQAAGRHVQLAISNDNLMDIWQALAATGAAT